MMVCRLQDILAERGMSRRELARRSGRNLNTVCTLAHAPNRLGGLGTLAQVSATVQLQPGELLVWETEQAASIAQLDTITGGTGNDTICGGNGDDTIRGHPGDDDIDGGNSDDLLGGGIGFDIVYGGNGDDDLQGGVGGDELYGETGDDEIGGGPGIDSCDGGRGTDTTNGTCESLVDIP
jgi:Ca2+-binding RTX toxin-like protein